VASTARHLVRSPGGERAPARRSGFRGAFWGDLAHRRSGVIVGLLRELEYRRAVWPYQRRVMKCVRGRRAGRAQAAKAEPAPVWHPPRVENRFAHLPLWRRAVVGIVAAICGELLPRGVPRAGWHTRRRTKSYLELAAGRLLACVASWASPPATAAERDGAIPVPPLSYPEPATRSCSWAPIARPPPTSHARRELRPMPSIEFSRGAAPIRCCAACAF